MSSHWSCLLTLLIANSNLKNVAQIELLQGSAEASLLIGLLEMLPVALDDIALVSQKKANDKYVSKKDSRLVIITNLVTTFIYSYLCIQLS